MPKRIVLTGGGTAGHVSPNLAIAPLLRCDGWDIHYIGSHHGIESIMAPEAGLAYHAISTGKLRRYFSMKNFTDPFRITGGTLQALRLLKKLKPKVVFSKGGFVSVPVAVAAGMCKIPLVLHESDITPGLANKLCLPFSDIVCTSFESTLKYTKGKGVHTGTPIRQYILKGDKDAGLAMCGFSRSLPNLLVIGGSLGAVAINDCVRSILDRLVAKYNVVHICGRGNLDESLLSKEGYAQFEFLGAELADIYAMANLAVSRAGATALSELLALSIPSLLIPLPLASSRGDQILNARFFFEKGYCAMLMQEDMNSASLAAGIDELYDNRGKYISGMKKSGAVGAANNVLKAIYSCVGD
ncbi:MAG: undecaprenyldiphospho-muramoylpentapeptide beta-N-acetylglucosaminyltransferase [Christensenellales bacterium]